MKTYYEQKDGVVKRMYEVPYDREAAISYAREWAFKRNPKYYNFDNLGGDCTNFISQCLFAGSGIMNHKKIFGWYYYSVNNRTPSWTGVPYLYNFLINNKKAGPFAEEIDRYYVSPGDILQLGNYNGNFYHSQIIVETDNDDVYIATHTDDAFMRPLSTYNYERVRFLRILGVRKN